MKNKILIIGAGFAGLSAARRLSKSGMGLDITVIDKKETADFLPLLPDCIGRGISPEFLSYEIQGLARRLGFNFISQDVTRLDLDKREVLINAARSLGYDYLVVSSGSETNFYGNENIRQHAYALDDADGARKIIRALKQNHFETFIIAGGGYTGIEVSSNLRLYLEKNKKNNRVIIVERAPSVLGPLPEWMKKYVVHNLERLNIEIFLNSTVEKIEDDRVMLSEGRSFNGALVIWVAGVKTAAFIQNLKVDKNPQGRIKVDEYLRLNGHCFVAGDAGNFSYNDNFLRMAVQFAITQGDCAAANIIRDIRGLKLIKYRPQDFGFIIPMANNRSCGTVLGLNLTGALPTMLHFIMCIYRSYGLKNKLGIIRALKRRAVMADWASLVLRISLGMVFVLHGLQAAFGMFSGPGINGFANMLSGLGFKPALFWACIGTGVELAGGFFLICGIFTRIAAFFISVFMVVALFKVHWARGFFLQAGGFEYNFVLICVCIALMILGPGKFGLTKKF